MSFLKTVSRRTMLATAGAALVAVVTAVSSLSFAAQSGGSDDELRGSNLTGVWFGTTFLGDPDDPGTPTVQYALTLHADRTVLITASDQTGQHPLFPGEGTSGHGTWQRLGRHVHIKTFQFADGPNPPETFGILRIAGEGQCVSENRIVGTGGFDVMPCPRGPMGCTSPNDSPFPPTNAFSFVLERFR